MNKEIKRIVDDLLPLNCQLPKTIVIGKLVFDYPCGHVSIDDIQLNIKERIRANTYVVTYEASSCLRQGVFTSYEGQETTEEELTECGQAGTRFISKGNILDFVKLIGDDNPIHRGDRAIVPGLMLLDLVLDELQDHLAGKGWRCQARFINPLYENQSFVLSKEAGRTWIKTAGGKEILRVTLEEKK